MNPAETAEMPQQPAKESSERPDSIDALALCLHQVFRPATHWHQEGNGNCMECRYDQERNRYCRGYSPIHVKILYNPYE